ncbi:MAG: gamma-glutamyl-gamma-aminobutyrate hydrolase family protein [Proteobacteria bacterium]|nr:gamma-glutamyl-gamma-aminobutyrate hydrolase family protein [Pseudomonadota bacterium]
MSDAPKPIVGIPSNQMDITGRGQNSHVVNMRYAESLAVHSGVMPVIIPAMTIDHPMDEILAHMDGILLTGGRTNVEPHHFGGPPFPDDEPIDPERDAVVLPMIRACIDRGIPVFGTCRGIQEINVALGGSLHYRVHELPGKNDHRMRRDADGNGIDVYDLRHPVTLTPGGMFHEWVGELELMVNSLHAQSVDRVADGLVVEAVSDDGIIEGLVLEGAKSLVVGVQWHAEFDPPSHSLSHEIYKAFGDAARVHAGQRLHKRVAS